MKDTLVMDDVGDIWVLKVLTLRRSACWVNTDKKPPPCDLVLHVNINKKKSRLVNVFSKHSSQCLRPPFNICFQSGAHSLLGRGGKSSSSG